MAKLFYFVAIFAIVACASHRNLSQVSQFDAYSADDSKDRVPVTMENYNAAWAKHGGAIFVFKEGDVIDVQAESKGDVLESIDATHLKVKRNLSVYMGKDALMVSFDGKNYRPIKEVLQAFSFALTIDDKAKKNRLTFIAAPKSPAQ